MVITPLGYNGFSAILGKEAVDIHMTEGDTLRLLAKNGPLNSDPFRITEA